MILLVLSLFFDRHSVSLVDSTDSADLAAKFLQKCSEARPGTSALSTGSDRSSVTPQFQPLNVRLHSKAQVTPFFCWVEIRSELVSISLRVIWLVWFVVS